MIENDICSIAGSCRERKSAAHWELLHQGGRWSKIERGDIVNKGDIVCNADDSQAAEEPLSVCDTSSIIPSPALSFPDLFHSPFTPFPFLNGWVSLLSFFLPAQVLTDCSGYLFQAFSLPHLLPVWVLFFPHSSFISLQSTRKPNTCLSFDFFVCVCVCVQIPIHLWKIHSFPPDSHTNIQVDEDIFVESDTFVMIFLLSGWRHEVKGSIGVPWDPARHKTQ